YSPEGRARHRSGVLFKAPAKLDPQRLVPVETDASRGFSVHALGAEHLRRREGFRLTDPGTGLAGALDQAHYCIWCHEQGKDSCSKGLPERKAAGAAGAARFRRSPFGVPLAGCPLEEKISEFHKAKAEGLPIGALAIIVVDNPMVAATGHRICNDCMKSCIYQKQEPVNIPQVETRTLRDAMLLMLLGYFLVVTNFLYSQSIPTALYMLLCVWVITAAMMSLHYLREEPPLAVRLRAAGALLAQSVPLMLVLFLFFPRVSGPLWGMPQDARAGVTGLSDTMSPGSLSNLILSDAVAFRVRFEGPIPPAKQLYWRGPVLWDFDGRVWSASRFLYGTPHYTARGEPLAYEVTLEPHNRRWLFALDLPARVPPRAMSSSDLQLRSTLPVTGRIRSRRPVRYRCTASGEQAVRSPPTAAANRPRLAA
ncbi:MAG: transglutaminaseTgpA domain-containing protein, partial [Chloroflexi bacterium]|nr:transglutaminaseTgpA domain-containing protein [Chloroflexota bacterium]